MAFSERLKEFRQDKGLSQKQLAEAIGVSWRAIQNYEYGKQEPTISVLISLANYFGISLDVLCGFNPYKIEFCEDGSGFIEATIKNLVSNKIFKLTLIVENDNNSLHLNHDIEQKNKFNSFRQIIKELPKYYVDQLDEEICKLLSSYIELGEDEKLDFSISTNVY